MIKKSTQKGFTPLEVSLAPKARVRRTSARLLLTGFTLVEVLVALFILGLTITGAFVLIGFDLSNSTRIRDETIASFLTQEGVEITRNIRDRDWFLGNPYGTSLPDGQWRVQWNSNSLILLGTNPPLRKDSGNGFYSYDSGSDTIFSRTVDIRMVSSNELKVVSTVTWQARGGTKSVSAEDHLFNWRRR